MIIELKAIRKRSYYNNLKWHVRDGRNKTGLCGNYATERHLGRVLRIESTDAEYCFKRANVCSRCAKRAIAAGMLLGCFKSKAVV